MKAEDGRDHKELLMRGAGVRQFGGPVEILELPEPRGLRPDDVLIDVRAWVAKVNNLPE